MKSAAAIKILRNTAKTPGAIRKRIYAGKVNTTCRQQIIVHYILGLGRFSTTIYCRTNLTLVCESVTLSAVVCLIFLIHRE
jgi:hypothetical protein